MSHSTHSMQNQPNAILPSWQGGADSALRPGPQPIAEGIVLELEEAHRVLNDLEIHTDRLLGTIPEENGTMGPRHAHDGALHTIRSSASEVAQRLIRLRNRLQAI